MTLNALGPAARAWMEAGRKTSKAASRRMQVHIYKAVLIWCLLQFCSNYLRAMDARSRDEPDRGEAWDFTLGIDHADAAAVVGGLGAIVFAINIAVFAARLNRSTDLRGEMDLAHWQRRMETVAPMAAVAALVVAGTRFPKEMGLGLVLLAVALISLSASDVRMAGRIGTLQMEAGVAHLLHVEARKRLSSFSESLPLRLQQRLRTAPNSENYLSIYVGFVVFLVLLKFGIEFISLISLAEGEWEKIYYSDPSIDYIFGALALTFVGISVLTFFSMLRIRPKPQALVVPKIWLFRFRVPLLAWELLLIVVVIVVEAFMAHPLLRIRHAVITFSIFAVVYLCLRLAIGPGEWLVRSKFDQLAADADAAELRAAAADEELEAEAALDAALADKTPPVAGSAHPGGLTLNFIRSLFVNR